LYSLSVFFPAYNDACSLPTLISKSFAVLEACSADFEVIVVNDGSRDDTPEVVSGLQAQYGPRLRVITHAENRGYGSALRSGFANAHKEFVFYTDGDGQYDVGELPLLLNRVSPQVVLVNGYKLQRRDPRHRIWIGITYNFFARLLYRISIRDIDCDYRLIRRSVLDSIRLSCSSGAVCVELVRKLERTGLGVLEVCVHHYPRLHGRSRFFRVQSLLTTFTELVRLYLQLVLLPAMRGEDRPSK
jgi:glycosyltransferase involved in cell wall biosynthesis